MPGSPRHDSRCMVGVRSLHGASVSIVTFGEIENVNSKYSEVSLIQWR